MKDEKEGCVPLDGRQVHVEGGSRELRDAHHMLDRLGVSGGRANPLSARLFAQLSGFHNGRPLPTETELVRAYLGPVPDLRDDPPGSVKGLPECAKPLQGGEARVVQEGVKDDG